MDKRRDDESLMSWERRIFTEEMLESRKAWCRREKNRGCNLECVRLDCQLHPEYIPAPNGKTTKQVN